MTLANALTLLRLAFAPVLFLTIMEGRDMFVLALLVLTAATDVADGWVARRMKQVSPLGTVLDPIADKVVVGTILAAGAFSARIPALLAWAYLAKEFIQLAVGGIFLIRRKGAPIKANRFGKTATTVTFIGFLLLWLGLGSGWWFVLAGFLIGLWAAFTYLGIARGRG